MTRLNKFASELKQNKATTCEKTQQQTISISVRQTAYNSTPLFIYLTDDGECSVRKFSRRVRNYLNNFNNMENKTQAEEREEGEKNIYRGSKGKGSA